VASSCTVPGLFPPVTIGGRRYIDGGVWSGSNADVVADGGRPALFIGLARLPGPLGRLSGPNLEREEKALADAGVTLTQITPGEGFADLTSNLMDPSRREPAVAVGREDGRRAAAAVATLLEG
jgi:NTE family protein